MRPGGQVITLGYFIFVHVSEAVHFILLTLFTDPFASDCILSLPIPTEFEVKHSPTDC